MVAALLLALAVALPPGAPDVTQPGWRLIGSRFLAIQQQGRSDPYLLRVERYMDSTSQNEVELRYDVNAEGGPLMSILWGRADADRWERFFVDRGYIVCVNKQHIIPAQPRLVGEWFDLDGAEAEACRVLSEA